MERGDLIGEVQEIFRESFDDDELELAESVTAADIPGWDSLMHINLIIAIENHFGIKFATAEISELKNEEKNVGSLLDLVAQKIEAAGR